MKNLKSILNIPPSKKYKKFTNYNGSITKINKPITGISKKTFLDSSHKFERALINLREGLAELSNEYKDEHHFNNYPNHILRKRELYSDNKYKYLRSHTPKIDPNLIQYNRNYLNFPNITSNLYLNTTYDDIFQDTKLRPSRMHTPSITSSRKYLNNQYYNDIKNIDKIYNININDISKPKEIIMLNNILKKQNKEFKEKVGDMRNKINELLNNLRMMRLDCQRLNNEK